MEAKEVPDSSLLQRLRSEKQEKPLTGVNLIFLFLFLKLIFK